MEIRYCLSLLMLSLIVLRSEILHAQALAVLKNAHEGSVSRYEPLEFSLSEPLSQGEHLALIIGTTDVTDLCTASGDTVRYHPQALPLPSGSVDVSVYRVSSDGTWTPIGNFTLNVRTSAGLEKNVVTPSITLSNKGQSAEDHFPAEPVPPRRKFQELNGQMALKMDLERSGIGVGVGFTIVGASFKQEALRFGEKKEDAPKIDLASYLIEVRTGRTTLSAGHFNYGRHRHLLNGFAGRGVSAATALGRFADVSGAVMSGTNVVGWDNFFGVNNVNHRIYSGTIGVEMLPQEPGIVRFEASYVDGSQQPLNNFNQARINDAEKSTGGSVRLLLSDPGRYLSLDAGFTKTRFANPADPLLAQGIDLVPVETATREARYADVRWDVFRNAIIFSLLPARLNVAFHHERVDPLYRAVGASTRADNLQNAVELHAGVGPLQMDITHLQSEDNLAAIPSILKTKTRQTGANVLLSPASVPGMLPLWLPALTYGLNSTHQFGVSTPTNSGFTPGRVPDQVTTIHTAGIEWQGSMLRLGYRGTYTTQDNRQVGREDADAVNRANGLNIFLSPIARLSITLEGSLESSEDTQSGSIVRNKRVGANILTQLFAGSSISFITALSGSEPDNGSSSQRQASFSLETAYAFDLSSRFVFNWRGQMFVRYSWSESKSQDKVFNIDIQTRVWTVNTGVTFTFF